MFGNMSRIRILIRDAVTALKEFQHPQIVALPSAAWL